MDEDYICTFATQLFDRNIVAGGLLSLNDFERQRGEKVRKIPRKCHTCSRAACRCCYGVGRARRRAGAVDGVFVAARGGARAAAALI